MTNFILIMTTLFILIIGTSLGTIGLIGTLLGVLPKKYISKVYLKFADYKSSLLAIIIVFIFYKVELLYFSKVLGFYWLLPLLSSSSILLLFVIKNEILSSKNCKYNDIQISKLVYLFFITCTFTSVYVILVYYLDNSFNDFVHYLLYALEINITIFALQVFDKDIFVDRHSNLTMDDKSNKHIVESSKQNTKTDNSSNKSSPSTNNSLNPLQYISKVISLGDHRLEASKIRGRMIKLIHQVESIKSKYDLQVIEEEDGSLGVELPESVDDREALIISKRIGVIDGVFNRYCDQMLGVFKKCDTICEEIKGQSSMASRQIDAVEKSKDKYSQTLTKYRSLIDEA